jgi:hypothetical protein
VTIIRIALPILFMLSYGALNHILYAGQEVRARGPGEDADTAAQSPPEQTMQLRKGTVELSVIGGTTVPVPLFRARTNRHLTMASLQIGRIMTNQLGGGPLSGHFELVLDITPLTFVRQSESVFGLAFSPVFFRWNFGSSAAHRSRVFAEASGGILYTNQPVPVRTTSFNFIDQAGFGVRFGTRANRAWLLGYRFQHVSNGGRVRPNPGANFNFVYAGLTFLR